MAALGNVCVDVGAWCKIPPLSFLENLMRRVTLFICLLLSVCAFAQEHEHLAKAKNATFEKLKTVLGDWESKQGEMTFHVSYKLVSGGTAIMETAGDGKTPPMINMYTPEGGKLTMVHYCAAGTQPRMRAGAPNGNDIAFDFVDIANLPDPNADHMHDMTLHIIDADHIEQEWRSMQGGKKTTYSFKLTRVKAS